jgi:hypothetical protein
MRLLTRLGQAVRRVPARSERAGRAEGLAPVPRETAGKPNTATDLAGMRRHATVLTVHARIMEPSRVADRADHRTNRAKARVANGWSRRPALTADTGLIPAAISARTASFGVGSELPTYAATVCFRKGTAAVGTRVLDDFGGNTLLIVALFAGPACVRT